MTVPVPDQLEYIYNADGSSTAFSYPKRFLQKDEIVVILRDADGVDTIKSLNIDYTIAGSSWPSGGTVTFGTAPASGLKVVLYRMTQAKQTCDLENNQRNDAPAVELQLDRLTMAIQDRGRLGDAAWYGLQQEIADRVAGDDALDARIDQEIVDRGAGDDALWAAFNSGAVTPGDVIAFPTIDALAAYAGETKKIAIVYAHGGRNGRFAFDSSDLSAQVAADTQQGIYVAPDSDSTGASGAWVRQCDGWLKAIWWGVKPGNNSAYSAGNAIAINAAISFAAATTSWGERIELPCGWINVDTTIEIPAYIELVGGGRRKTFLRCTATGAAVSPIVHLNGLRASLQGVNVSYASKPTDAGICILSEAASARITDFTADAGYTGLQVKSGSGQRVSHFDITDCTYSGLMIGATTDGFINDVWFDNFLIVSNDHANFSLGAIRVLGRAEAIMFNTADLIGSYRAFTSSASVAGQGLRFSNFTNVFFDSHDNPCYFNNISYTTFTDCWISGRAIGAYIMGGCHDITFQGLRVYNNNRSGVVITEASHHITFSGCQFGRNGSDATGVDNDLIISADCSYITVKDCQGSENNSTQYAVLLNSGASNITIADCDFATRNNGVLAGISGASGYSVRNVRGFVTKAKGTSTLPASATSVTVTHGMSITPTLQEISIVPNGASQTPLYVSAVTSTTFTVTTQTANTGGTPFTWVVDAEQR